VAKAYADDVNGRVLRSMNASGADMTVPYDVDFEHVFPDLGAAEGFRERIGKAGCRVELCEYDGASGYFWQVRVVVRMVPTHAAISSVERELGVMAEACAGRSDGWVFSTELPKVDCGEWSYANFCS
jgi:hypothetical protein